MENLDLINILIKKQDMIIQDMTEIKITLAHQEENLRNHMRRSDALEKYVAQLEADLKPVQKHIYFIEGALKFLGVAAAMISISIGLYKIYSILFLSGNII